MNEDDVLAIVTTILTILLIISELLGMSKCDSNSILQALNKIRFNGCTTSAEHDDHQLKRERRILEESTSSI